MYGIFGLRQIQEKKTYRKMRFSNNYMFAYYLYAYTVHSHSTRHPHSMKSFGETFQEIFHEKLAKTLLQYYCNFSKIFSVRFQET